MTMTHPEPIQRIIRLTPLADVLAAIEKDVKPVAPHNGPAALGRILAADAVAASKLPAALTALRDGWALNSGDTTDAGPYAPLPLRQSPQWTNAGAALPAGTDSIAPFDAVLVETDPARIVAPVAPGEGTLPAGADARASEPLKRSGERLRASDIAAFAVAGIATVSLREPRLHLVHATRAPTTDTTAILIATAIACAGGMAIADGDELEAALHDEAADAVIAVGGTGSGRGDRSVEILAKTGRVLAHGIGLSPGETTAFGFVGSRPVLLLPGRFDAALSAWLTLGCSLLARLCAQTGDVMPRTGMLKRKVTSSIGMTEVVPVRCDGDSVEPLASGYWPAQILARADGWIVVPAASEGYPAGTIVTVRPLP